MKCDSPIGPLQPGVKHCPSYEDHTRVTGPLEQSWEAQSQQSPTENVTLTGKS